MGTKLSFLGTEVIYTVILRYFCRQRKIVDRTGFRDFIGAESAFIAQRATVEYCRARAGANASALFEEPVFLQALSRTGWEALAVVLSDTLIVAEGALRGQFSGTEAILHHALVALYRDCLEAHPRPAHRTAGWADVEAGFAARLAAAQNAAPRPAERIGRESVPLIFRLLPIHPTLRALDEEIVQGNLRFALIGFQEKLLRRADISAIAAALSTPPATCAGSASAADR